MDVIVAITGASGVTIGVRLLHVLAARADVRVHLVLSDAGRAVMAQEMAPDTPLPCTWQWQAGDLAAPIASSSRAPSAMVVAPCSMKTLSAIAHGYSAGLIARAADVMLRLDRPLVLLPRETPLSLPAIENMRLARLAGAVLLPPVVAYYPRPRTIDDVTDFLVGKILDTLHLDHDLYRRWGDTP